MKFIIAIIQPHRLDDVREALHSLGIDGVTVSEVKGYGRQKGHTEIYRGAEYVVNFVPKIRLEIVTEEKRANEVIDTIAAAARTGKVGDGKIFSFDIETAMRIRTGETGVEAI
ncbi:MAG: transcriptional regulator [Hyphomicrobiales bacterium]|nr:MAG: transcriptional regulator [Hyphomicrobiales bacterium]